MSEMSRPNVFKILTMTIIDFVLFSTQRVINEIERTFRNHLLLKIFSYTIWFSTKQISRIWCHGQALSPWSCSQTAKLKLGCKLNIKLKPCNLIPGRMLSFFMNKCMTSKAEVAITPKKKKTKIKIFSIRPFIRMQNVLQLLRFEG